MKLKKLFAGIVAVAMMATMAIPGFAATGGETEAPSTDNPAITVSGSTFTIGKTYTVTGTAPNEDFELKQVERVSATKSEVTDFAGTNANTHYDLTIGKANYTGSADGLGFSVTLPDYNKHPGIYTYKLKEKDNGTAGVTYDANNYILTVYAVQKNPNDEDSKENDLEYKVRLDRGDVAKTLGEDGYKVTGLNNSYESGTYTVKKLVKGNMADRKADFYFRATFDNIDKMSGQIKANGENIELVMSADRKTGTYDFSLKHAETISFTNVPAGVAVSVNEKTGLNGDIIAKPAEGAENPTNGTYTVEYTQNQSATMANAEITAIITNRSTENLNTGVILDNAPYIALLTIVAAGAVVMIIKKRRNYED